MPRQRAQCTSHWPHVMCLGELQGWVDVLLSRHYKLSPCSRRGLARLKA